MAERSKPYHHGNLRAALLKAAERKLARGGVQALSLRELARDVGVSHGAPRQYFRNKQALLDALAETGFERLGKELDAAMADLGPGLVEALTVFAQTYVRFASRQSALLDLMFASLHRPGADPRLRRANDRSFHTPLELINAARANGEIVADDPDRAAMAIVATLQGLAWLVTSRMIGKRPVDAVIADTISVLIHGLEPRPTTRRSRG